MSNKEIIIKANDLRRKMALNEYDVVDFDLMLHYCSRKDIIITFFSNLLKIDTLENLTKVYGTDASVTLDELGNTIIVLNDTISNNELYSEYRLLFSLCHEIAHIELNHFVNFFTKSYKKMERECNIFATNFLMPENAFLNFVEFYHNDKSYLDANDIKSIAEHYNVSWTCCIIRLDELNIQKKKISDNLVSTYNIRKQESLLANLDIREVTGHYLRKGVL